MRTISSFRGEFSFLSNFAPSPIRMRGVVYPTAEHAYQAAKTLDLAERERVRACATPGQAKRMGRSLTLRRNWNAIREQVMLGILRQKFSREPLRSRLLATSGAALIEGNSWHDNFWGACECVRCTSHALVAENRLGVLLMQVRDELESQDEAFFLEQERAS